MPKRDIYLLSPKQLSPETIAVAFAKTSRSPESFREIAAELSDEKSAQFHEKWVVGIRARLGGRTCRAAPGHRERLAPGGGEHREQPPGLLHRKIHPLPEMGAEDDFIIPPELDGHPLREEYIQTCRLLFETYAESLAPVRELVEAQSPRAARTRTMRPTTAASARSTSIRAASCCRPLRWPTWA